MVILLGGHGEGDVPESLQFLRRRSVDAQLHTCLLEGLGHEGEGGAQQAFVDNEVFGRVADAGTLALGVDGDLDGRLTVDRLVEVDIADTLVMLDDRHAGVFSDKADKSLAAPGNEAMDVLIQLQEHAEGVAVNRRDELDGIGRQTGLLKRLLDDPGQGHVAVVGLASAPEDGGVAALEAEDRAIDGDVGPRLIDNPDDPDRDTHLLDGESLLVGLRFEDGADRIGQGRHLAGALDHAPDALGGQAETVEQGIGEAQ